MLIDQKKSQSLEIIFPCQKLCAKNSAHLRQWVRLCRFNLLAVLAAAKGPAPLGAPRLLNASMYKKKRKEKKRKNKENKEAEKKRERERERES